MSAFIAVVYRDCVEILNDAAVLDPDGCLSEVRSKCWRSYNTRLAVTGRGSAPIVDAVANGILMLAECGSFDGTLIALQNTLDVTPGGNAPYCEWIIAGISETRGPTAFVFQTQDEVDIAALKLVQAPGYAYGGPTVDLDDVLRGLERDLDRRGVRAMEKIRRTPGRPTGSPEGTPEFYAVGGFVEHTRISAARMENRILHVWPDTIGEPINPFAPLNVRLSA